MRPTSSPLAATSVAIKVPLVALLVEHLTHTGSTTWLLCCLPKFKECVCSLDLFLFPVEIQTIAALNW